MPPYLNTPLFVRKNRQGRGELLNCYRKMVQIKMVTPTNHVIAGPTLHRAELLAL